MKLAQSMATVAGLTGVSRIAGFVRDIMTASILGAGPVADAFFVALKLPNFFRRITAEGAFSVSFVPMYTAALEKEGRAAADEFAGNAMCVMFWVLSAFTILIMIAMPLVIDLIAPGFTHDPVRHHLATSLSRITFPYLLMMSIASLLGGVLNAHGRFAPYAAAPILFNISLIFLLLFAWKFKTVGHALAWGVLVAGVLQFVMLWFVIRREGIHVRLSKPRFDANIKKLFKLMGPGVIGSGVMQINLFSDMIIASLLPTGAISHLYYADRLGQLPLGIIGIAVGTVLLPMLSRTVAAGRTEDARDLFNRALEYSLLLALPAATALLVIAGPIVTGLFRHGAFTWDSARMTALVLTAYSAGLPAYIGMKVFATAFWAKQDTATPVRLSVFATFLNIALGLFFVFVLKTDVVGIAAATSIAGWVQIAMFLYYLKGREDTRFDARFLSNAAKIGVSCALMAAVLAVLGHFAAPYYNEGRAGGNFMQLIILAGLVACGLGVYAASVLGSGAVRIDQVRLYLNRRNTAVIDEGAGA